MLSADEESLSLLKRLFGRRGDGMLAIEKMAVVPLRSDGGTDTDFYRVREDLFLVQPNYISTILSTLGQSIVPIVAIVPGENTVRCLGTGFFVSAEGLLVTAAHVVIDPIERRYGGVRQVDAEQLVHG